jgi:LCP family protein required for cell wall assembly
MFKPIFTLVHRKPKGHFFGRLGRIVVLAGVGGAALAWGLSWVPLPPEKGQGLSPRDHLVGVFPATLTRPTHLLILGIDNTAKGRSQGLEGNSDTLLLVRVEHSPPALTVLSIPRDTRIRLGERGAKINSANARGGVKLSAQSVSQLLGGVRVDRYVRMGTEGLVAMGNALGGVRIDVPKAMHYEDKTQGLSIHFEQGSQVLNGRQLQEYARFRQDGLGDIGRVERQQQVIQAMLGKLLNPLTLVRLPFVLGAIQQNVDSDLSLGEMAAITQVIARTPQSERQFLLLPGRASSSAEYALSYWLPNSSRIQTLVNRHFAATGGDRSFSQPVTVPVAVANGTQTPKLAAKAVFMLQEQGFSQAYITREKPYSNLERTQILVAQGDRQAAERIKATLGLGQVKHVSAMKGKPQVMVVVGSDMARRLASRDQ